jgi:tRNA(Ile)-lysidine synthase TilS/MesJ
LFNKLVVRVFDDLLFVRGGKLKLVRPFVYVRERETKQYARLHNLPVITENCPACFEEPKERARLKALLKAQETLYPTIFPQLVAALRPLMHPDFHADKIFKDLSKNRAEQRQESFLSLRAFAKELREKEAATSDEHEGTTSPLTEPAEVPTPALN